MEITGEDVKKIAGFCYSHYVDSKGRTTTQGLGCASSIVRDAAGLTRDEFNQKYGKILNMATTPPKTTDDIFKGLQDFQSIFGQKLDLLDQQVNQANSKIQSVATDVSNIPDSSSSGSGGGFGGMSTTTLLIIGAALVFFLFRKKLF